TIDGGFSCPNRDGTISSLGCIYCDDGGSFSQSCDNKLPIEEQVKIGIEQQHKRYGANKFIVYFQAFSNTYKPVNELKKIYDSAFCDDRIVGISIGTRPDCVDEEKLKLISSYKDKYEVWIEYGLQSIHNKTLKLINRGHDYECFENAYKLTKKYGIKICTHVIIGLPEESKQDIIKTAQKLSELKVDGVKFHCLCLLENSPLMNYKKFQPTEEDYYADIVCDFIELLPETTTIHRLAANGKNDKLIAPLWLKKRFGTINKIDKIMENRKSFQGIKCSN
ncbi:TIGR01212 family radical SAM protein, partial [bacterium]|nr:TIGR01212 family radical SAM protein [bacterium]